MDSPAGQNPNPIVSEFATDPEMADLVRLFLSELPARIATLESAWRSQRLSQVTRMAHQLKGSCSGYGFPTIGTAAAALEDRLRALTETDEEAMLELARAEFRSLVELCARACRSA